MGSTESCVRKIITGENSTIYGYEDYSVEYFCWGSHFKAVELPNGMAGAREPCELTVWARPGHGNYILYRKNFAQNYLPNWWVAA